MLKSLFIITLLGVVISMAATNYRTSLLTNSDGLSYSAVSSFCQDASNILWFGTWDGLNTYDGQDITVNKHNPNNYNSLSNI